VLPYLVAVAQGGTVTFDVLTSFDYPGGSSTQPRAINNANEVAGSFVDVDARIKGFTRAADGTFSPPLVEPNDFCLWTIAVGINDSAVVSGYFHGPNAFFRVSFFPKALTRSSMFLARMTRLLQG